MDGVTELTGFVEMAGLRMGILQTVGFAAYDDFVVVVAAAGCGG